MNSKIKGAELKYYQWLCDLSFLTDILNHLNSLNLHLQGASKFILSLYDHIKAFQREMELLQKQLKNGDLSHFMACKKLIKKDWIDNEALLLQRLRMLNKYIQ